MRGAIYETPSPSLVRSNADKGATNQYDCRGPSNNHSNCVAELQLLAKVAHSYNSITGIPQL